MDAGGASTTSSSHKKWLPSFSVGALNKRVSGKDPISSTTVVVGVAGEGQGAHASSSTTAHQVFDNRPKSNSEVAKVNAAQVFDILSDCRRKAVFSPEDSYTLGEDDTSSDEESSSSIQ